MMHGVWLLSIAALASAQKFGGEDAKCSAHPECASSGLKDNCCPTAEGKVLNCCASVDCTTVSGDCHQCARFAYCSDPTMPKDFCDQSPNANGQCAEMLTGDCKTCAGADCSSAPVACDECAKFAYCMDPSRTTDLMAFMNCRTMPDYCVKFCAQYAPCMNCLVAPKICDNCKSNAACKKMCAKYAHCECDQQAVKECGDDLNSALAGVDATLNFANFQTDFCNKLNAFASCFVPKIQGCADDFISQAHEKVTQLTTKLKTDYHLECNFNFVV